MRGNTLTSRCWCGLSKKTAGLFLTDSLRASDFDGRDLVKTTIRNGRRSPTTNKSNRIVTPSGSVGFRWGEQGKWNLEEKAGDGSETDLSLTFKDKTAEFASVAFPYFGNRQHDYFHGTDHPDVLERNIPVKSLSLKDGEARVATVFDLFCANYGLDRGFGGDHVATSYDEDVPYTPAWQEAITGVPRDKVVAVARAFAENAETTRGKSMVILGAGLNHWYHMDMNYRGIINMLVMCGCIGQSGGGWSHYVGQEKLRPQTGWLPLGVRSRLGASAAPHEFNIVLVRAYGSMALRNLGFK